MYTTIASIKAQFPQFTAAQWGTGVLPTDHQIDAEIISAAGRVDDFLRGVYALPFTPNTPVTIANATVQLVVASLRQKFSALSPQTDKQGPDIERGAVTLLKAMGEGHPPYLEWPRAEAVESPGGAPLAADPPSYPGHTPTRLLPRDKVY